MAKIVPSERLRGELDEVLAGVGEHDDPVEAVAWLIMQQALEEEVTEFLGRSVASAPTVTATRATATATSPGR